MKGVTKLAAVTQEISEFARSTGYPRRSIARRKRFLRSFVDDIWSYWPRRCLLSGIFLFVFLLGFRLDDGIEILLSRNHGTQHSVRSRVPQAPNQPSIESLLSLSTETLNLPFMTPAMDPEASEADVFSSGSCPERAAH